MEIKVQYRIIRAGVSRNGATLTPGVILTLDGSGIEGGDRVLYFTQENGPKVSISDDKLDKYVKLI